MRTDKIEKSYNLYGTLEGKDWYFQYGVKDFDFWFSKSNGGEMTGRDFEQQTFDSLKEAVEYASNDGDFSEVQIQRATLVVKKTYWRQKACGTGSYYQRYKTVLTEKEIIWQ